MGMVQHMDCSTMAGIKFTWSITTKPKKVVRNRLTPDECYGILNILPGNLTKG